MNREETIERVFNTLIEQGKVSERTDILGTDPIEDKVYTKRIAIDRNIGDGINATKVKFVSIKSDDRTFSDVSSSDMRINTKNTRDQWCNIFATEATDEMLELVSSTIQ